LNACICVLDFSKCLRLCVLYLCARTHEVCAFGFIVFVCSTSENVCVCVYCICGFNFRKIRSTEYMFVIHAHTCYNRVTIQTHISPPHTIHTHNTLIATCKRTNTQQKKKPKRLQKFNPPLLQQITHTYTPTHTYTHIHTHTQTSRKGNSISVQKCMRVCICTYAIHGCHTQTHLAKS